MISIPTWYANVKFRSRQEARWAVLFNTLQFDWRYEAEGYQLPSGWYLPDFWLPQITSFAEVKGIAEQWDEIAMVKACELAAATGRIVILCDELRPYSSILRAMWPHLPYVDTEAIDVYMSFVKARPWHETLSADDWSLDKSQHSAGWYDAVQAALSESFRYEPRRA